MEGSQNRSLTNAWTVTVQLLLSIFELLLSDSPHIFNYIWSYRTPIQAKFMALES